MDFAKSYILYLAIRGISEYSVREIEKMKIHNLNTSAWRKKERMQTEDLVCLAEKVRNSMPNVEAFPIATIYTTIKEQEKVNMNLPDFKKLIYHLTGWDISFQVIRRQLEINQIVW